MGVPRNFWCLHWVHLVKKKAGPQCKTFNYGLQGELMGADDVLQNYLVQFLEYLAENLNNLKFQETRKAVIFRPSNSYTLHCHGECGLYTFYLKVNCMKNSKFGKKLNFIHVHFGTTMQNF